MTISGKQEIYTEMLFLALPTIRNIQTQSMVKKAFDRTCLEEAELVHTLHYSILEPAFTDNDIHFLNVQAKNYAAKGKMSPAYTAQLKLIAELFSLVPFDRATQLHWHGPYRENK
ncbi:zinc ABC transporter substrate-binding protein [Candidatus Electrothrix sp.]|uniref:zinc ABC transporter substrate-binding protein n=1 Tax=Candidatus Electrothrix sp. TaxID=2170559 RepID=UPI00405681AA